VEAISFVPDHAVVCGRAGDHDAHDAHDAQEEQHDVSIKI